MSDTKKPTLCLDFDGVLHSYTSGWKGADVIPDEPVPDAMFFLHQAAWHFDVQIFSSRSNQPGGVDAMKAWLRKHLEKTLGEVTGTNVFRALRFPLEKPPALVTIDDRAICFTGAWPSMQELKEFKPWNKR